MTRATARERAMSALTVIDRHHDQSGNGPWDIPGLTLAFAQLGKAMTELYGPLPNEGLTLAHIRDDG